MITDNAFNKTRKNLKRNRKVAIVCGHGEAWYQLKGIVAYHSKGKWLEFVRKLPTNKDYDPKGAVLVKIKEGYDLGNVKRLF